MNIALNTSAYAELAAIFPKLIVTAEFYIQDTSIYFSMTPFNKPDVYLHAAVQANQKTDTFDFNLSNDPQNGIDVEFDKLYVDANSRPIIDDFQYMAVIRGQPFEMTDCQICDLNDMLNEYFVDLKVEQMKTSSELEFPL